MVFDIFSEKMKELINKKGFIEPTLAQKMAIPLVSNNESVLIIAPTGVGKTESAMLPLIDKVYKNKDKPIAILYITPLRALNRDLMTRLFWWADKMDLEIAVRHGDTSLKERAEQRTAPPHIMITTPETLNAIITGKTIKNHLKNVKYVIIDELHELIESKRGSQLSIILERLKKLVGKKFQIIGLSATIGNPKTAAKFLGENIKITEALQNKKIDISVETPKPANTILLDKLLFPTDVYARIERIIELTEQHKSVLLFTNTRSTAEALASRIKQYLTLTKKEIAIDVHHGSLSKETRIKAEQKFKNQETRLLICTSSLELGIDIGSVDLVIQYLSPRQVTRFTQRLGRSGHNINKTSKAIILTEGEDAFESCSITENTMKKKLEKPSIFKKPLDVMAQQIIGLSLDEYDIKSNDAYQIIKRAYPYRGLTKAEFDEVVNFMAKSRLIWTNRLNENEYTIRRNRQSWNYYFENLSTIPDTKKVNVINIITKETIGYLDESFVAEYADQGNGFIINGTPWNVVDFDERKLYVEPSTNIESAIPSWTGELVPVDYEIAQYVGTLRNGVKVEHCDIETEKEMKKIIKKQKIIPDDKTIVVETYKDFIITHACFGSKTNEALGKYIAAKIIEERGHSVQIKTDPYRIIIRGGIKPKKIIDIIKKIENPERIIKNYIETSTLFKWRFLQVAKRFGIITRKANYDKLGISKLIGLYRVSPVYEETLNEIFKEKLDVKTLMKVAKMLSNDEIKIKTNKKIGELGKLALKRQFSDVILPDKPEEEFFKIFKRRLLRTQLRLVCTNCFNYSVLKSVENMKEFEMCPKCGSGMLAVINKNKKINKNNDLDLKRSASLYITYGKRFAFTMAAHGVGTETAARILAKLPRTEDDLLKLILKAEKKFLSTKKYWK